MYLGYAGGEEPFLCPIAVTGSWPDDSGPPAYQGAGGLCTEGGYCKVVATKRLLLCQSANSLGIRGAKSRAPCDEHSRGQAEPESARHDQPGCSRWRSEGAGNVSSSGVPVLNVLRVSVPHIQYRAIVWKYFRRTEVGPCSDAGVSPSPLVINGFKRHPKICDLGLDGACDILGQGEHGFLLVHRNDFFLDTACGRRRARRAIRGRGRGEIRVTDDWVSVDR